MAEKKNAVLEWFKKGGEAISDSLTGVRDTVKAANAKKPSTTTPTYSLPDLSGKKYSSVDLSKYSGGYKPSDTLTALGKQSAAAEAALKNYGDFKYGRQGEYDLAMDALLNREGFSYDVNGDALYQQYKDRFTTQGKQASMDVMGQAATMTGGYGNSYAATVGNQTYQGYLQGLNDKIPELYQLALGRYNAEGDRLAANYSLLSADRENARAEYESGYEKLAADRDYLATKYNNERGFEYGKWSDSRDYDTAQYWNENEFGYKKDQDAIDRQMALAQLNETIRANKASEDMAREQLELSKNQPAEVDYAITNWSDIPDSITKKLDDIFEKSSATIKAGPFELPTFGLKKDPEKIEKEMSAYIDGMVTAGEMSPQLGLALLEHYMSKID